MRRAALTLLAFSASLGACAPYHDAIAPIWVDPAAYLGANCAELALMRAKTNRTLIFAEVAQDQQARDDDTRSFGVPTPMATIFERSRAPEVADLKGESIALDAALLRKGCVASY